MSDSMLKEKHKLVAEESIANFISFLEDSHGNKVSKEDKQWLFEKGLEFFEAYYVEDQIKVNLISAEERRELSAYLDKIQITLSRMFAHIMLIEFKLRLLGKENI